MKNDWSEVAFSADGEVDVEETRWLRNHRNIPPNPPPSKAHPNGMDGKALARIAVYDIIDSGSWKSQAVMQWYIDRSSRVQGLCYPSEELTANQIRANTRTIRRINKWWCRIGYTVNGEWMPLLKIAARGRIKTDGTRESNAYHVGWVPLIAIVRDHHYDQKVRREAVLVLERLDKSVQQPQDKSVQSHRTNVSA
jgi:hypothetical protein